ncbi:hypothetical protein BSCG_04392 [Bacteroides sp. 2_2_4]|nr:hypothetical protein BSCG_04392 [Bacteroides sp. 2_2_4]CAG9878618.1 hypothetical protein BOVA115_2645 [Bacteroides ovatus]
MVFCSKNYRPILPELHWITDHFNVFCYYIIMVYGKDVKLQWIYFFSFLLSFMSTKQ